MNILEIGAGTGKYSHYFARKGYTPKLVRIYLYSKETL